MYGKEQSFLGYEIQIISLLLMLRIEAGASNLGSLLMLNMHATLPEPLLMIINIIDVPRFYSFYTKAKDDQ